MYVLIFIVAFGNGYKEPSGSAVMEFTTKDKCMAAQSLLMEQAKARGNTMISNACLPK